MSEPNQFDPWLTDDGPAALVIREHLQTVEGPGGVVFPATFAPADPADSASSREHILVHAKVEDKRAELIWKRQQFKGGYNIDFFDDGRNVCLIDSVGSQANRIEPIFMKEKYAGLVPQVVVKAGEKRVNLLEAGHRAGDAIVRCSALKDLLQRAFRAVQRGDADPLARIAPTSLVFGVWDSRDTQAKLPRLISSVIRAYDVKQHTRSALYLPAAEYVKEGLLPEPAAKEKAYSERGFSHVPASAKPGGVEATHGIRRDATLSLVALRLLSVGRDEVKTLALRRYVLGLSLTAFTHSPPGYLRQGCLLVTDPDRPREFVEVFGDGRRVPASVTHDAALAYATAAAKAFGVGEDREVEFDKELAKQDVKGEASEAKKPKK
jgi:CRISPR-associated protein Csb1